nr:unnamed protein product [Callosobruchus analis]
MTILLISIRHYTKRKSTKMRIYNTPYSLSPPKITMSVSNTCNFCILTCTRRYSAIKITTLNHTLKNDSCYKYKGPVMCDVTLRKFLKAL